MVAPQPAMVVPREITHKTISLNHKPNAIIHYTFARGSNDPILVIFLNGLMSDKTSWIPVMAGIIRQRKGSATSFPSMLAYDRYGQGMTSEHDPQDEGKEKGHGHGCKDAAGDLYQVILQISKDQMSTTPDHLRIVLVANSIGCAIARLYAQSHPVSGLLFLDSIMANSDFDIWPNPDSPTFKPEDLPSDVPVETLRSQREKFLSIFHPSTPNREGLSRRSLALLLPHSEKPILTGRGSEEDKGHRPWITVIGHDFSTFADESLRTMDTPISLSMKYSNPAWHTYNQGLAKLTSTDRSKGPTQAIGCGHFIQRDDPNLVVDETL